MKNLNQIKQKIQQSGLKIESEKIIQNGIQFRIKNCGHLRIYWRKDGQTTIDLSQIKSSCLQKLNDILNKLDERIFEMQDDLEIQKKVLDNLPDDPKMILPAIGSDESGKGDIFGPLVVAAVYIGKVEYDNFGKKLKDSKLLSDKKISDLANRIKSSCEYSIAIVEPKDLVNVENMNELLEDLHAHCIRNVLTKKKSFIAIYDDFGAKGLKEKLEICDDLTVLGFKKAEVNPAVAAASIIARAEFLSWIDNVSRQYDVKIPLGAGQRATEFAMNFLKNHGLKELERIAKMNFSNVRNLISK
ncbi:ribonuclease HIII [Thermotoga profunda]|uniref:ribonuclease HIII n=1 Tax=Thermotoga profunda TaxID=1508420 RepID=UPI00059780B0|nr:ribonuclease HIII [Thermotoga profunda]